MASKASPSSFATTAAQPPGPIPRKPRQASLATPKAPATGAARLDTADPAALAGARDSAILAELRHCLAQRAPSPKAILSLCKAWAARGRALSDAAGGPRSTPLWDAIHRIDSPTAHTLAKLGLLGLSDSALGRLASQEPDPKLIPAAHPLARGFAHLLLQSAETPGAHRCARGAILRGRALVKRDPALAQHALDGSRAAISSICAAAIDTPKRERDAAELFGLAHALCGAAIGPELRAAKAELTRQKEHGDGLAAWGAAAMAAFASDSLPVLRKVVEGLIETDAEGIHAKFIVERKIGPRSARDRQGLLASALRAGALQCADHLVDMGAASRLLANGPLPEADNPFCALRGGVARAANGKGASGAPAKIFSKIARAMADSLLAQGLTPLAAKAMVEQAAQAANKRLSSSASKAALESLLLAQTIELADLGTEPAPAKANRPKSRL